MSEIKEERKFNPAVFRYALAEQIDIASRKWTAVAVLDSIGSLETRLNEKGDTGSGAAR